MVPDREAEYSLQWSPDGRYLAFGVYETEESIYSRRLYVYDVEADEVVDLCPTLDEGYRAVSNLLVWSPDSRWVAYVPGGDPGDETPLVIINVFTGEHYRLADFSGELAGWSDKFSGPED